MNKSILNLINHGDLSGITTYQAAAAQATANRILQKFCDEVLRPYGITKTQWLIIGVVWDGGTAGVRITDLSVQLATGLPYLTNAINTLELREMVYRVEHGQDSRAKMVTLNPAFEPKCQEIETTLRQALRKSIYADISPEDFRVYMRVMYQLSQVRT